MNYKHIFIQGERLWGAAKTKLTVLLVLYCISVNKKCTDVECTLTSEMYNLKSETFRTILERLLNLDNSLLL